MKSKVHPFFDQQNFLSTLGTAVLLGVTAGALGDWLADDLKVPRSWIWSIGLAGFISAAYWVRSRLEQAAGPQTLELTRREPLEAAGLIALVSKGQGSNSVRDAIAYHAKALLHLWLITTAEGKPDAEAILGETATTFPNITLHPLELLTDPNDLEEAVGRVTELRRQALKRGELREVDLICDFTGLTKNASAGMVLACAHAGARLQYMIATEKDERERGLRNSKPIEVVISYSVSRE